MYLWIGCQLPESFEQELRGLCFEYNRDLGLDTVAFSLPQHVSLKISFETADHEAVLEDLTEFLRRQKPFSVRVCSAERSGKILWLPIAENAVLRQLHGELDQRLEQRFGVPQHEFDKAFMFHSTLFIDDDLQTLDAMRRRLSAHALERELPVRSFLLGVSPSGKAGDYKVIRRIDL